MPSEVPVFTEPLAAALETLVMKSTYAGKLEINASSLVVDDDHSHRALDAGRLRRRLHFSRPAQLIRAPSSSERFRSAMCVLRLSTRSGRGF